MPSPPGGSIEVFGGPEFEGEGRGVLWVLNAVYPCPPREEWKSDCRKKRIENFKKALDKFADLIRGGVNVTRIVVPQFTGCTQSYDAAVASSASNKEEKDRAAKAEDWAKIVTHLETFADKMGVDVLVTASLEASEGEAPYKRLPPHTMAPGEAMFRVSLLELKALSPLLTGGSWGHVDMQKMVARSAEAREKDAKAAKEAMVENPMLLLLATPYIDATQVMEIQQLAKEKPAVAPASPPVSAKRDRSEEWSPNSKSSKRSRTSEEPPPEPTVWTKETWFKAHITDVMTPDAIERMRKLRQGSDAWLECEAKQACLTTSNFGACHSAMSGGSQKRLDDVGQKAVWRTRIPANKFMQWGTYHEDDGKGAFAAAAAFGVMETMPVTPFDRATAPFLQITNQRLMDWSQAARRGKAPFRVEEVMDSRGVNVDVEAKVLAYSYDGMYKIQSAAEAAEAAKPTNVLIEVKCTSTLLTAPREDHMCQMLGMLGGLRKQGYAIDRCVYVNWQRHVTRFWSISFDAVMYQRLLREMLWVWHNFLLPLFVARDNGILPRGRLEIPIEIDDIDDDEDV